MRAKDIVPPVEIRTILFHVKPASSLERPALGDTTNSWPVDRRPWESLWHDLKTASSSYGAVPAKSWWSSP